MRRLLERKKKKKKEEKGKAVEMLDFYLDDIIIHDNGTYSLIAEQFTITSPKQARMPMTRVILRR